MIAVHMVRWSARVSALALLGLVALLCFGEGMPNLLRASLAENLQFLAFAVVLAGLVRGWRWEGLGGALVVGGLGGFSALNYLAVGRLPSGAFPLFFVPGLLYLASNGQGLATGIVLRTELGEQDINKVWLAPAEEQEGGTGGPLAARGAPPPGGSR
jgi:hypothetical protein